MLKALQNLVNGKQLRQEETGLSKGEAAPLTGAQHTADHAKTENQIMVSQSLEKMIQFDFSKPNVFPEGLIGESANNLRQSIGGTLNQLQKQVALFNASTGQLSSLSSNLMSGALVVRNDATSASDSASIVNSHINEVSEAIGELGTSMNSIAETTTLYREDVSTISSSTEGLRIASQEIAENTVQAKAISEQAVSEVEHAIHQVSELEHAAAEITLVTNAISEISEQTKLLALNATIEAASAGAAGRGFAVVAGEVKELASQTSAATDNIKQKVDVIQKAVALCINAIQNINNVIGDVSGITNVIASAAEEQTITTRNMAESLNDASEKVNAISTSVNEGVKAVEDINCNLSSSVDQMSTVTSAIKNIAGQAANIHSNSNVAFAQAVEVSQHSEDLLFDFDAYQFEPGMAGGENTRNGLFQFSPKYSVLVDDMDQEHIQIFDFVNQIHQQIKDQASIVNILQTFKRLASFTAQHFATEEALLLKHSYPGLDAQKRAHIKLLNEVGVYIEKIEQGEDVNLIGVLMFLNNWLKEHILKDDLQYGQYFQERGIHT